MAITAETTKLINAFEIKQDFGQFAYNYVYNHLPFKKKIYPSEITRANFHRPGLLRDTVLGQPIKIDANTIVLRIGGGQSQAIAPYYEELNTQTQITKNLDYNTPYTNVHYGYIGKIVNGLAQTISESVGGELIRKG